MTRIALASMFNETSHFLTSTADLQHWHNTYVLPGAAGLSLRGATCEEAGAIAVLDAAQVEIVPLLMARSVSSGPTTAEAYRFIRDGILDALRQSLPVDGVMLAMHGSMTAVDEDDPEGDLMARIRAIVGDGVPIVSTLDLHGNVTARMVAQADALVAFTRYPHDDTFTTGERGARLLLDLVDGKRTAMALAKVPVICSGINGMTFGDRPMTHLTARARGLEAEPGILSASIFHVHATNDLPGLGSGGLVVTDGDAARAEREARAIAADFWDRRTAFEPELLAPDVAIRRALSIEGSPVLLVDTADCVGGGAPGDSVALLGHLLALKVDVPTYVMVVDAEAAIRAAAAGVGASVTLDLGYHSDPSWGSPLPVTGVVRHVLDGDFVYTGGAYGGTTAHMGLSVVLAVGAISVLVMSLPTYDWADEQFRAAGLDVRFAKLIGVKNPMNYNFAYGDIMKAALVLDTPGPTPATTRRLPYKRMQRPFFPLDSDIPGLEPTVFVNPGRRG